MRGILSPVSGVISLVVFISLTCWPALIWAQEPDKSDRDTVEPVFRVPKIGPETESTVEPPGSADVLPSDQLVKPQPPAVAAEATGGPVARVADARGNDSTSVDPAIVPEKKSVSVIPKVDLSQGTVDSHPLDRAIEIAKSGLDHMQNNIRDYTAILVKRERVGNQLGEREYMKIKIRNPRTVQNREVPFSIYMKFVKPRGVAGREVIWVDGQNNNNLIAHEPTALVRFKNFHLPPTGFLAMKGNKYPIYDAGLENLVLKLIEKAERDRGAGACEVRYLEGAKINQRPCTLIEVEHARNCAPYEFHLAKVYIDDQMNVPVGFVAYDWPMGGNQPEIMEEYTYINVNLNVGLTDSDFDIANASYNFAK